MSKALRPIRTFYGTTSASRLGDQVEVTFDSRLDNAGEDDQLVVTPSDGQPPFILHVLSKLKRDEIAVGGFGPDRADWLFRVRLVAGRTWKVELEAQHVELLDTQNGRKA